MSKKNKIIASVTGFLLLAISISYTVFGKGIDNTLEIKNMIIDKSMYNPGETVTISLDLYNKKNKDIKDINLILTATHLGKEIGEPIKINVEGLKANENKTLEFKWESPKEDFKGYLLSVSVQNRKNNEYCFETVGVDISSSWVKFPRYGYLHDYGQNVDEKEKIDIMNRYHINAIEYYDWKYLHHKPIADGVTKENVGAWQDWAGKDIYGETIKSYIDNARNKNMVNMAYNMIYAGTNSFFRDDSGERTEANKWKLQFEEDNDRGIGDFTFRMGASPSGNGTLYFLNPLNKDWQNYIFAEENKIFDVFNFDGWHGDTVGDWGNMTTVDGEPLGTDEKGNPIYLVSETYKQFLNNAKDSLGKHYLSFNPVGAKGIEDVNGSNVDVLYAEFWPWDFDREGKQFDTYYSIAKEVERSMEDSKELSFDGKGKSLTVKSYINYEMVDGYFNDPAVILSDAAVYAAGGSRLEIGNGDSMLHHEYYAKDNEVLMSEDLKAYMIKMSDFIVAYENILRDGQITTDNKVEIEDVKTSKDGKKNTVWTYTREDKEHEIVHLINLLDTDNKWRDESGNKNTPTAIKDLNVKYYTDSIVEEVKIASPDLNNCISKDLKFEKGSDSKGKYIEFTVPSLDYWDMIYLKREKTNVKLVNGDFETGDLTGWNGTTSRVGVDNNDVFEGKSKVWFWGEQAYDAKLSQSLQGIKDGKYTVKAWVKQSFGTPEVARMELTGYGGEPLYVDIPQSNAYMEIAGTVEIKSGELNIAFVVDSKGQSNLQIDKVQILEGEVKPEETPIPESFMTITNGDFEKGDLSNWLSIGASAGVDDGDVYEGNYKAYFWNNSPYTQKIQQKIVGLENGEYTVRVWVKQNVGTPNSSRLELSGFGGEDVYVDIQSHDKYYDIVAHANVINEELIVTIAQDSSGETNLQLDKIELLEGHIDAVGIVKPVSYGKITNGGFETGDFTGWETSLGNNAGVDNNDVAEGNHKAYFWGENAYKQKLEQTIVQLDNGVYTVVAKIKQSIGKPSLSQMVLTTANGVNEYINIPIGVFNYTEVYKSINVTDGYLNIAFIQETMESANLQMDDVKLIKGYYEPPKPVIPVSHKDITNGSFETGDLTGWLSTESSVGVDANDAFDGNHKAWFYGKGEIKIEQIVDQLENGTYTVKAFVKQNTGTPKTSKLIVSETGSTTVEVNIPKSDSYVEIALPVEVKNGKMQITFVNYSTDEANLQIDNVRLFKGNVEVEVPKIPVSHKDITNGGFETGDLTGWLGTGSSFGVDGSDAYAGNNKVWFFGKGQIKLEQIVDELENGTYTVKAWVKQNTGTPKASKMVVSPLNGSTVETKITSGNHYTEIAATVEVLNGQLQISFINESDEEANLQIDEVTLVKGEVKPEEPVKPQIPVSHRSLTNGGFENGDLKGWLGTGSSLGVDSSDAYAGNNKVWFFGKDEIKLEQIVDELENGTYTISAYVKQSFGTPEVSEMRISNFGGEDVVVNVPHGDNYQKIEGKVEVKNGQLQITFMNKSIEEANLQIDEVTLVKGELVPENPDPEEPAKPQIPVSHRSLTNGGFENGDLTGWLGTGNSLGVDSSDAYAGNNKVWFFGKDEIKLEQIVDELENGTYIISAYVKQSFGTPEVSEMRISNFSGGDVVVNIPHGDNYQRIEATVEVRNGHLQIAFMNKSIGEANLQIDEVVLTKQGNIINGGFEDGLTGWIGTGSSYGVDGSDAYSGNNKVWFFGSGEIKIEQLVKPLANGTYTISAYVKQSFGTPEVSEMRISNFGVEDVIVNITHGDEYQKIEATVEVKNNQLQIAFINNSIEGANLQIDDVVLFKH
jgi:dextranase